MLVFFPRPAPDTPPPVPVWPAASSLPEEPVWLARTTERRVVIFVEDEVQALIERCDRDHGWVTVFSRQTVTCWPAKAPPWDEAVEPIAPLWREDAEGYPIGPHHTPLPAWAERELERCARPGP